MYFFRQQDLHMGPGWATVLRNMQCLFDSRSQSVCQLQHFTRTHKAIAYRKIRISPRLRWCWLNRNNQKGVYVGFGEYLHVFLEGAGLYNLWRRAKHPLLWRTCHWCPFHVIRPLISAEFRDITSGEFKNRYPRPLDKGPKKNLNWHGISYKTIFQNICWFYHLYR